MADAGWYPDPSNPMQWRYWDGLQWTAATQMPAAPLPPPPPFGAGVAPLRSDLDSTIATGRQAANWLWGAAVILVVTLVAYAFIYNKMFRGFFDLIDEAQRSSSTRYSGSGGGTTATTFQPFASFEDDAKWINVVSPMLQLLQLGQLCIGVLFAVWLYKAAKLAERLGARASLRPYWAVLGFIIPIVNLWFPYLVARDCLPPGYAGRRSVAAWWGLYLAATCSGVLVLFASLGSVTLAVTIALAAGGVGFMAVVKAREMITAIGEAQTDLVERAVGGQGVAAMWTRR